MSVAHSCEDNAVEVIQLRPRYRRWKALEECSFGGRHLWLADDGTLVGLFRVIYGKWQTEVARDGTQAVVIEDEALSKGMEEKSLEPAGLAPDGRALLFRGMGRLFRRPLDARERGTYSGEVPRNPSTQARPMFSSKDGDVFRRESDGATLSLSSPCWFPEGWPVLPIGRLAFRRGADPLTGVPLKIEEVQRRFCSDNLVEQFLRGESMDAHPSAVLNDHPR